MGLREYFKKRNFRGTPEPAPKPAKHSPAHRLRFVVQEHHASQLHYDFRLEVDGVLKSWAVPKGPSLNPHDHHLAIQTEDHPYEYRNFEGVIPEHNYGAGNVIIWDEGWYEARAGVPEASEKTMRSELKKGHATFVLHGKKLNGEFALIRMPRAKEHDAWLLIKKSDVYASTKDVTAENTSVRSHKQVDDLGAKGKLPDLQDYPKRSRPWQVTPMLCTLINEPFDRDGWLFEVKWDGFRAIATRHAGTTELYSRNHLDFRSKYPPVVAALETLKRDVILDGEIVAVDSEGVPHFEWLQNWHRDPQGSLQYQVFDMLWCDGHDVRTMPLMRRKALLKAVLPESTVLRYSGEVETNGTTLFKEMQRRGLEGMVAKRGDSPYREADRGQDWLKVKTHLRQEVVIGGYTEPRGSRKYLGSLLVGVYDKEQFVFVGHSGGGIPDEERKRLRATLERLERKTSPFAVAPKPNAPVHWVRPEVVCEMSFSEWTSDGLMRHPEFEGLRPDKAPKNVRREMLTSTVPTSLPKKADTNLPFEPTHAEKIFFPKHKYTKGDLFTYYTAVAPFILPYLKDRPLSLNRMPDGITGESFFQKNNEHLPDWVPHADIFSDANHAKLRWIVGGDLATLLYIVQLGSIEINPWNARIGQLDNPDWIVIDLDPEGVDFNTVITVARSVREVCDAWHIPCYPKTSGKTGLHIFIPLHAAYTFEQGKNLAHLIALEVNAREPKITSVERDPAKRKHRVYLDFLQNREGQTLAAPYSVRPTPDATVSMPLHWDEVKPGLNPKQFTIENTLTRLKHTGDIWKPVLGPGISIPDTLRHIEAAR
jgi:bifunctional non-homologous end joining protein LigD